MKKPLRLSEAMKSETTLEAAKALIKQGRRVVLTYGVHENGSCTCARSDCPSPGKHPLSEFFPEGVHSATGDLALVRRALKKHPKANLAMTLDEMTVVDVDGKKGREALKNLKHFKTIKVLTGRGHHLYFDGELSGGSFKGEELDVLSGSGRMIMMPPSNHPNGKSYRYARATGAKAARVPSQIVNLKPNLRESAQTVETDQDGELMIKTGSRNDFFFRTARFLRRRFRDESALTAILGALNKEFTETPLSLKELKSLIRSSKRYADDSSSLFGPPDTVVPLPMEFLFYPYIPYFGVTLLAGNPGMGKSLLVANLISAVTTGAPWPLSKENAPKGTVLLLSAEDNWQRVTLPRLAQCGADVEQIHVMKRFKALSPENLEAMAQYIEKLRPKLVVIDTLSAYMGGARDMNRQNEVGEFLGGLTEIAEEAGCAILAIGHLNKQTTEHPLFRIVGSIGFAASIRSALFYGTDPQDRSRFALAHGKANASELGEAIIFERFGGGREGTPKLVAVEYSDADAMEICKVETNSVGRPNSVSQAAREYILDFLGDEPVKWRQVEQAVIGRNLASEGTLNVLRAEMSKLGEIVQVGAGKNPRWKRGSDHSI